MLLIWMETSVCMKIELMLSLKFFLHQNEAECVSDLKRLPLGLLCNFCLEQNQRVISIVFILFKVNLEHTEPLPASTFPLSFMGNNIELYCLGQRAALSNSYDITFLHRESRTAMGMNVLVTFLKTTVLLDVVKVIPANDDSTLHLSGNDKTFDNLSTNGNISSEGALLVHVISLDGSVGSFDSKTNILHPAHWLYLFGIHVTFACNKDGILSLVGLFVLYREPPPHDNWAHVDRRQKQN